MHRQKKQEEELSRQKVILANYQALVNKVLQEFFNVPLEEIFSVRECDIEHIDETLEMLDINRYKHSYSKLFRMWFGMDGKKFTANDIAQLLDVSRGRVYQLKKRIWRMLRHPTRSRRFLRFCRSGMEKIISEQEKRIAELESMLASSDERFLRHRLIEEFGPSWEDASIEKFDLSFRTHNCLWNAKIRTVSRLLTKSQKDLLKLKNFGRICINEVLDVLSVYGLYLKGDKPVG